GMLGEETHERDGGDGHHLRRGQRRGRCRPGPAVDGGQLTENVTGAEYVEEDFVSVDGDGDFYLAGAHDEHIVSVVAFEEQDRMRRITTHAPHPEQLYLPCRVE